MNDRKGLGLFALVILSLVAISLLLFACIHNHAHGGWYCLLTVIPLFVAMFVPGIYYGYVPARAMHLQDTNLDPATLDNCRQLGYAVGVTLLFFCYAVPVLVWYNTDSFPWHGVLVMDGSISCALMAFSLWVRIFKWEQ